MELKLTKKEVLKILLEWAEKEMPGKFNTITLASYNNEAELTFVIPKEVTDICNPKGDRAEQVPKIAFSAEGQEI